MFSKYFQIRNWLEQFIPLVYGKEELGLKRIENLLKLLGNPEEQFKSIHIAGTSGKGSTSYLIAQLLRSVDPKLKIGLHISPHLVDLRERMQILGKGVSDPFAEMGKFIQLFNEIKPIVEKIQKDNPDLSPSYFEILVAASFKYFAEEKVDFAVVEVGLGGRLDATNVIIPEVSVITNIGLDHTEILGDTVEKIAAEKAGIIKKEVPVVTGAVGGALAVIERVAKFKNARVLKVGSIKNKEYRDLNFKLAKLAVEELGFKITDNQIAKIKFSGLPGRFEEIEPGVILDGAHNPDKVQALIRWLKTSNEWATSGKGVVLVIAFKTGKDWKKMVDLLIRELPIMKVVATQYQAVTDTGKGSSIDPNEIGKYITKVHNLECELITNSQEAVFEAVQGSNVLITGSLYLVGEARSIWELPEF